MSTENNLQNVEKLKKVVCIDTFSGDCRRFIIWMGSDVIMECDFGTGSRSRSDQFLAGTWLVSAQQNFSWRDVERWWSPLGWRAFMETEMGRHE